MTARDLRVLVAVASRHGATAELAAALARAVTDSAAGRDAGITAVSVPVEQRPDPTAYDAVVLGSAIYLGRWLGSAREYAAVHAGELRNRPVWLFSSGPIGEPPFPADDPHDAVPLVVLTGARGHRLFAGDLEKGRLSWGERAVVTAMHAPVGDFRDWRAVKAWGEEIAAEVVSLGTAPTAPPG